MGLYFETDHAHGVNVIHWIWGESAALRRTPFEGLSLYFWRCGWDVKVFAEIFALSPFPMVWTFS